MIVPHVLSWQQFCQYTKTSFCLSDHTVIFAYGYWPHTGSEHVTKFLPRPNRIRFPVKIQLMLVGYQVVTVGYFLADSVGSISCQMVKFCFYIYSVLSALITLIFLKPQMVFGIHISLDLWTWWSKSCVNCVIFQKVLTDVSK